MTKKQNNVHSYNSRTSTNAKEQCNSYNSRTSTKRQKHNVYSYNSRTDKNTCNVYNYNARTSTNEFQKHNVYNATMQELPKLTPNTKSKNTMYTAQLSITYSSFYDSSSLYIYCRARILVGQLVQHKNNETNSHILPYCYHMTRACCKHSTVGCRHSFWHLIYCINHCPILDFFKYSVL